MRRSGEYCHGKTGGNERGDHRGGKGFPMPTVFIKRLPEGYDTVLGEDGDKKSRRDKKNAAFSGLCIARVVRRNFACHRYRKNTEKSTEKC